MQQKFALLEMGGYEKAKKNMVFLVETEKKPFDPLLLFTELSLIRAKPFTKHLKKNFSRTETSIYFFFAMTSNRF